MRRRTPLKGGAGRDAIQRRLKGARVVMWVLSNVNDVPEPQGQRRIWFGEKRTSFGFREKIDFCLPENKLGLQPYRWR